MAGRNVNFHNKWLVGEVKQWKVVGRHAEIGSWMMVMKINGWRSVMIGHIITHNSFRLAHTCGPFNAKLFVSLVRKIDRA